MRDVKEVEVRRAEIMSAALQLFAQKGYLKTRTQDIIDKLGISRGLLYYHFKDKEDILYCLIEKNSEPLLRKLEKISYQPNVGAKEKIRAFIEATPYPRGKQNTGKSSLAGNRQFGDQSLCFRSLLS